MLSVEQCKKFLKGSGRDEKQIETIRDSIYQLANILVDEFIKKDTKTNDNQPKQ